MIAKDKVCDQGRPRFHHLGGSEEGWKDRSLCRSCLWKNFESVREMWEISEGRKKKKWGCEPCLSSLRAVAGWKKEKNDLFSGEASPKKTRVES